MSDRVKPDGYNTPVPAKILTPDRVETHIGTLEFTDGFPTEATAQLLYDHLDFVRGVEVFLSGVPAASLEAMRIGMEEPTWAGQVRTAARAASTSSCRPVTTDPSRTATSCRSRRHGSTG